MYTPIKNINFKYAPNENLLLGFLTIFFIFFILQLLTFRYFELDFLNQFLFAIDDIWCPPPDLKPIFPRHCFGDYGHTVINAISEDPWGEFMNANPYPPVTMTYFSFFHFIGQLFNWPGIGFLTYLLVMIISLSIPSIYILTRKNISHKTLKFLLLSPLLGAGLYALDRGNIVALVIPWVFFSLLALAKDNYISFALFIFLAATIKPQFIILLIVLLLFNKYKIFIITGISYVMLNVAILATFYNQFPIHYHIRRYLNNLEYFSYYQSVQTEGIENLSFSRGIYLLTKNLNVTIYDYSLDDKISLAVYLDKYPNHLQFYLIFLLFSLIFFIVKSNNLKSYTYNIYLLLLLFVISFSHVSYQYYSSVVIPFVAFLLLGKNRIFLSDGIGSRLLKIYTFFYLSFFLHPFFLFQFTIEAESFNLKLYNNSLYYIPILNIVFFILFTFNSISEKVNQTNGF